MSPDSSPVLQVTDDEVYLVVNAGCSEKDLLHINKHLAKYKVHPGSRVRHSGLDITPISHV